MRRLYFILISLMLTMAVMAEGIDRNAALLKAQKFMPGKEFTMGKTPARARAKAPQKSDAFYVFNAKDNGGFVIVSGDDRTEDILCYSERGNLDVDQVPENMKWWLDELARQIEALGTSLEAAPHRAPSAAIAPLIKSKWSQHAPYNYMCPDGNYVDYDESGYNTGNRCVTGCVATAMAQIMYYWKWPKTCPALDAYEVSTSKTLKALPATTFKWDKMKDTYGWNETGTSANAVAELMRYCGQAVHMWYSPSGSGAAVSANVMASIFEYSPNSHDISRDNYSVSRWESIIYDELANQRPVLYDGGSNSSAHQFIVDGYDGAGLFHFNWGWGGSSDCYGVLSLADPYGDGNGYQYGQGAIIGVKPAENGEVMMPFMYSWIDNRTPVATYNRPASADNFTSVSLNGQVYAQYTLEPTSSLDVEMGWGLFQDDRMLQLLDSKTMTFEASSRWGNYYAYDASASFGTGLADGTYELSHVYRFSSDTEWEPCHLYGNRFLAEIKGNTLKVFVPNPDNMSFSVNSLTTSDEPIANETVSVNVNITNTGESREEIVSLWIQKPSDEQWTNISKISCWVDLGKSYDVTTSFIPDVAGIYQLKITSGSSEEALATTTIKVADSELVVVDGITYRCIPDYRKAIVINDGKNYHDISGDVTILQKVTASGVDCQVTRIADRAFEDWYQIASVTIPEGVTSIGNNAFAYCNNLNKVVLPSTVTRFGENIFYYCNHLSAVCSYIQNPPAVSDYTFTTSRWNEQTQQYDLTPSPATLYVPVGTKAQYEALAGWKWFAGIEEGELLEATVGGLRYYYSTGNGKATVIQDASYQELTEVSIPATVSIDGKSYRVIAIGSSAFDNCWQLQSLTLAEGIETIGDRALSGLNITKLILPSTLKTIGEQAFIYSSSIKTLTIPEGVTTIGYYAFAYMGLTKLELPATLKEIGDRVIQGCSRLEAVVSHITNPYAVSDYTFTTSRWNEQTQQYDLTPSPATLYVPIGTKAQYEALAGWKWFAGIEEGELLEATVGGLRYSYCTGNGKATVIQDNSYQELTEISIPATVSIDGKSYRVIAIGSSAFRSCWQLQSLTLSEGLETIGNDAFNNSNGIKTLTIPEGVTTIGNYAFAYMYGLTKLELPATLTEFGRRLIEGCSRLETVISRNTNPPAISDNTFAYQIWNEQTQQYDLTSSPATLYVPIGTKAQYEALSGWKWFAGIEEGELLEATVGGLRYYYSTGNGKATVIKDASYQELTEVSIPATVGIDGKNYRVTGIGNSAFSGCWQLQSVTLPEGLETIGENAFYNSNSIKTLTIPEGVTTIGNYAFAYMYGLTKLELPSSLKEIGVQVIEGCTELMSVVSRNTNPPAISDNTFATNRWNEQTQQYDLTPSLATLYVPIGTKAQYESLSGWKWFTDIEEGEPQETTIGRLRYSYSTSGEKATVIQDTSYQEFTELSIPATVSIDGKEYRVTGIGNSAFYNCWQLRSLTLPEGLETIGRQAFMYVPVSELTLPTSLKTIREQAFYNCRGIKNLTIPEGVTSIGDYAFAYMYGLTKLELPATLTEFGIRLIKGCTKLEAVVSHITVPQAISNYTFATSTWNDQTQQEDMTPCTATLYVPIGTKAQYEAQSGWTWFANIVESEQAGTGIATMEHRAATDGRWYNLQGQPIDKPQKGVFIRNGRKVVVK